MHPNYHQATKTFREKLIQMVQMASPQKQPDPVATARTTALP